VVVFISAEYAARDWTRVECRAALAKAVRELREYVLQARFDDTPLSTRLTRSISFGPISARCRDGLHACLETRSWESIIWRRTSSDRPMRPREG
jgi:hypothetical protein